MTFSLTDIPAGHVFEPIQFTVSAAQARAYRHAVGESSGLAAGHALVPPLAVAALALAALLAQVGLPPGTLHTGESVAFHAGVSEGATLECRARLSQRSARAGWIVSVLDSEILSAGSLAVSSRATVFSPPL